MMSPHRVAERLDRLYRRIGMGLAVEMMARGVLALATAPGRDTVFQVTAGSFFPFAIIGGVLIMICHRSRRETTRRYVVGVAGHFLGAVWALMFGIAIVVSWLLRPDTLRQIYECWVSGVCKNPGSASIIIAPIFLCAAALHGAFFYNSVKGAKWTRQRSP